MHTENMGRRLERSNNFRWFVVEKRDDDLQPDSRSCSRSESAANAEKADEKEPELDDSTRTEKSVEVSHRRRGAISPNSAIKCDSDLMGIEQVMKVKDWLTSFQLLDPRWQILKFFNDLSREGVDSFVSNGAEDARYSIDVPKLLRGFTKSGMFTVWRPTSPDAIRKMMTGEGTGKGLDIKGKSALRGPFSGFVPFLQISDNSHKSEVGPMSVHKRVRVFYPNEASRDTAFNSLVRLALSAGTKITQSARFVRILLNIFKIDDYASSQGVYGIDIPEKVFWEGFVAQKDITRQEGSKYDTGRQSMPAFQQMNIETLRSWDADDSGPLHHEADPRPVLWHASCAPSYDNELGNCDPLCPQGLLMAYEEDGKVTPVVSDFDCFLLGTRGVKYQQPFRDKELSMLSWCIEEINGVLSTPKEGVPWTSRWLEVKKKLVDTKKCCFQEMPKFGYADPRSYAIIKGAVKRLKENGAVRHGPECFNYAFPQELDNQFLVISDTFPGVPWRYVSRQKLIDILCEKIDEGFTFPLNPKWILCDPGWKRVYDNLLASQKPNVQDSMNIWYPTEIRRRIDEIATQYPQGFVYAGSIRLTDDSFTHTRATLAEFELTNYRIRVCSKKMSPRAVFGQNDSVLMRCNSLDSPFEHRGSNEGQATSQEKTGAAFAA